LNEELDLEKARKYGHSLGFSKHVVSDNEAKEIS